MSKDIKKKWTENPKKLETILKQVVSQKSSFMKPLQSGTVFFYLIKSQFKTCSLSLLISSIPF